MLRLKSNRVKLSLPKKEPDLMDTCQNCFRSRQKMIFAGGLCWYCSTRPNAANEAQRAKFMQYEWDEVEKEYYTGFAYRRPNPYDINKISLKSYRILKNYLKKLEEDKKENMETFLINFPTKEQCHAHIQKLMRLHGGSVIYEVEPSKIVGGGFNIMIHQATFDYLVRRCINDTVKEVEEEKEPKYRSILIKHVDTYGDTEETEIEYEYKGIFKIEMTQENNLVITLAE
jgi:hypothetical protein